MKRYVSITAASLALCVLAGRDADGRGGFGGFHGGGGFSGGFSHEGKLSRIAS